MQIAQPQPVNALMAGQKFRQEFDQSAEKQNMLRSQEGRAATRFDQEQADRGRKLEYEGLSKVYNAFAMGMNAKDPAQGQRIFEALMPEEYKGKFKFRALGQNTEFQLEDGTTIKAPTALMVDMFKALGANPENMDDPNFQAHMRSYIANHPGISIKQPKNITSGGSGTEAERYAARHGVSLLEAKRAIKKATTLGMSDEDKRRYDKWDERAYNIKREIQKLESSLSVMPKPKKGEKDFFADKRALLKDYKEDLKYYERKMDTIIKPKGAGNITVPQAVLDHWKGKGKTIEEIETEWKRKKELELSY